MALCRQALEVWKRREAKGRDGICHQLIMQFEEMGGPEQSGIVFSEHKDVFERARVNAQKLLRWMDDETKDGGLMNPNFLPWFVAALPQDLGLWLAGELLAPASLTAGVADRGVAVLYPARDLAALGNEAADAISAVASLVDGIDAGEVPHARVQLLELKAEVDALLAKLPVDANGLECA
jgi:hypothetical protein